MKKLLALLIIVLSSFLLFSPTFVTALHGDEWKAIWLARQALAIKGNYMPVPISATPYVFEHMTLDWISRLFPLYSGMYSFVSYLIRLLAAYSVFRLAKKLSKSSSSAYIASFLFAVSSIGIEAVIWTRNYSAYISLIIFIFVYLKYIYAKKINILAILFSFLLILLVNTTRSHGFVILYFLTLGNLAFKKIYRKKALLSLFFILVLFMLSATSPYFGGQAAKLIPSDFDIKTFAFSTIGNIGRIFVAGPDYKRFIFLSVFVLILNWKKYYLKKFLSMLIWSSYLFAGIATYYYAATIQTEFYQPVFFGAFFLILITTSLFYEFLIKSKDFKNTLLVFGFTISFLLIPMIRQPQVHMGSDHRYLIHAAVVIPLIAAFAMKKFSYSAAVSIFVIIYIFSYQTFSMLEIHRKAHGSHFTKNVWQLVENKTDKDLFFDKSKQILIYTTPEIASEINASIYFGFAYHVGLVYEVWDEELLPTDSLMFTSRELLENYQSDKEKVYLVFN